jgi:hypothetical protein
MKRGKWCMSVLALLLGSAIALADALSPSAPAPAISSTRPYSRTFLLESAGGLGAGVGIAAIGLPFTLAAYLFSAGDITQTVAAEEVLLGLGSAVGACWTGRNLGQPARLWPALGLAFLPEVGTGLVMYITRKGADLTDPLIMGCCVGTALASPVLATVGANLGRRTAESEADSRLQVVPELCACPGAPHLSAGLELRLSF